MKQIWPNYSYSPTTNVLTLTGLNIDRDQLLLVSAPERGRIMYNFADSAVTASAFTAGANTALTLVATTAGLTTTASLVIYYDDQLQSTSVSISNFPATQTIAGTVTANVFGYDKNLDEFKKIPIQDCQEVVSGADDVIPVLPCNEFGNISSSNPLPISGTVTIGAGTAQIGSVTASISGTVPISISSVTVGNSVTIGSLPAISGTVTANVPDLSSCVEAFDESNPQNVIGVHVKNLNNEVFGNSGNPFPISGTVTAVNHQGTSVTTSNFTSTTASTTLASANASREVLTIFNEGAGNLHICAGATCTTIAYQVRLSAGDYYEVPLNQTSLTHSAVFATAGTARVTQIS